MGMMSGIALAGAVWAGRTSYYASVSGLTLVDADHSEAALLAGLQDALIIAGMVCFVAVALTWIGGHRAKNERDLLGTAVQE